MSSQIPRVSIGLPVYNGEAYLAEAIESVLAQTFADFELIISDNASTDRTSEICQDYAAQDDRIRYYREPNNRGIGWNFTRTFDLARGELFKWQAHDDLCDPRMLEQCVQAFDANPEIVLAYPRVAIIDERGEIIADDPATWRPPTQFTQTKLADIDSNADRRGLDSASAVTRFYGILLNTVWCLEPYGLIRTAAMRTTGKLRNYCGAEKVFLAEMALRGKFQEVPEVLFFARRHAQQYTMLASGSAQQRSVNPRRFSLHLPIPRQVRSTLGYGLLLPAAPIGWFNRLRCGGVLVRYIFQTNKWKRIFVNALRDVGINDGYLQVSQPEANPDEGELIADSANCRSSAPANSI
jgi:glycosyltransferase involved in cell wall biosynthesis